MKTIEQKALAYDEAIRKAKDMLSYKEVRQEDIEYLFPELAESEDERIRKEIVRFIQMEVEDEIVGDKWIAWLKKQESVEEIVERCKKSWYNEGKIQGQIEGLTDEEKYQQGWHDALEKQDNKSINIDIESMVSSYKQRLKSQGQGGMENSPLVNMCLIAFRHGAENVLEELNLKKLEKQGEKPQGKSALEAIKEKPVDNANKVASAWNNGYSNGYIHAIEKACDWLKNHNDYIDVKDGNVTYFDMEKCVEDFRKAMKGGDE